MDIWIRANVYNVVNMLCQSRLVILLQYVAQTDIKYWEMCLNMKIFKLYKITF